MDSYTALSEYNHSKTCTLYSFDSATDFWGSIHSELNHFPIHSKFSRNISISLPIMHLSPENGTFLATNWLAFLSKIRRRSEATPPTANSPSELPELHPKPENPTGPTSKMKSVSSEWNCSAIGRISQRNQVIWRWRTHFWGICCWYVELGMNRKGFWLGEDYSVAIGAGGGESVPLEVSWMHSRCFLTIDSEIEWVSPLISTLKAPLKGEWASIWICYFLSLTSDVTRFWYIYYALCKMGYISLTQTFTTFMNFQSVIHHSIIISFRISKLISITI